MPKKRFLYRQVYEGVKASILNGTLPSGSKMPTEEELTLEYNVSTITVKKALELLATEGLVNRVPGRGTFVSAKVEEIKEKQDIGRQEKEEKNLSYKNNEKRRYPSNEKYIGLVLEHVSSPFGLDMMYYMDQEAEKAGYKLIIRFSYGRREKETEEINFLRSIGAAGMIIMPCHGDHYNTAILKLVIEKYPIVLIDKKMTGIPVPSVRTDGKEAVKILVRHLFEKGCRNIGLITLDVNGTTSLIDRRKGFYSGVEEMGLQTYEECVLPHEYTNFLESNAESIYVELIRNYLLEMKEKLDGVICTEFGIISAFVQASKELDIEIGTDLKVCCIDEEYLAPNGYTFTHMKQDEKVIAKQSMELMLKSIEGKELSKENYEIPAFFLEGITS